MYLYIYTPLQELNNGLGKDTGVFQIHVATALVYHLADKYFTNYQIIVE